MRNAVTDALYNRLEKELEQRRQDHLLRVLEVQNTCRLNLCNNDYFQLRSHPDVVEGARESLERYGTPKQKDHGLQHRS